MFIAFGPRAKVLKALEEIVNQAVAPAQQASREFGTLLKLREEIETLKIGKARLEEENARAMREVEHKVGLERKRQEFEVDAAKREVTLKVREENLQADQRRFKDQMEFHEKRFSEEVGYLKGMLGQVLTKLGVEGEEPKKEKKRG